MKQIEILGPGCHRCSKLAEAAEKAAQSLNLDYELKKISDMGAIISYGVMMTPALVVDGEVKSSGRVPSVEEIAGMIR
jgi:small redox-active disulfide protein 2